MTAYKIWTATLWVFSVFICALDPCPGHVNKTWLFCTCMLVWLIGGTEPAVPTVGFPFHRLEKHTAAGSWRDTLFGQVGGSGERGTSSTFTCEKGSAVKPTLFFFILAWWPRQVFPEGLLKSLYGSTLGLLWRAGALTIWGILNWRDGMLFIKHFHELGVQTSLFNPPSGYL